MKKSKFSEKQILDILKEQEFGKTVAEIISSGNLKSVEFYTNFRICM